RSRRTVRAAREIRSGFGRGAQRPSRESFAALHERETVRKSGACGGNSSRETTEGSRAPAACRSVQVSRRRLSRRSRQNRAAGGRYRAQGRPAAGSVAATALEFLLPAEGSAADRADLGDAPATPSEAGVLAQRPRYQVPPTAFQAGRFLLPRFEIRRGHARRCCGLRGPRTGSNRSRITRRCGSRAGNRLAPGRPCGRARAPLSTNARV